MKLRKTTSLFLMTSGFVILTTGVLLLFRKYGVPSTAVNVSKNVHEFIAPIFVVTMIIHTYLNIKPLLNYSVDKSKKFTTAFVASVAVVGALSMYLTYTALQEPASSPIPSANNMPIEIVLDFANIDTDIAFKNLEDKGFIIPNVENLTLNMLAEVNQVNPKMIYSYMVAN